MKFFTEKELKITNANPEVRQNMFTLVDKILDPLREKVGVIIVNSAYRTPEYNKSVGGVPNSQHTKGQAVDIVFKKYNIDEVFALIIREFDYDQVILENSDNGSRWIHVSYNRKGNRRQALTAKKINGKWKYTPV